MLISLNLLWRKLCKIRDCWQTHLRVCLTAATLIFLIPLTLNAQNSSADEYQLKAAFVYNFTRFVEWPASGSNRPGVPFVISVLNEDRLADKIHELVKGEQIGSRPIVVRRLNKKSEIGNCNILYVSGKDASELKDQLSNISRRGVLTVSDAPNFARWGGIIRFFKDENKLRMQINIDEARSSRFGISSKLLSLSSIYNSN